MVAEPGLPPPQEQIPERTCEQVVDVRMPQVIGQVLDVPKISSQDRDLHGTVEQIPDVPVPEMVEQLVKLPKTESDDRTQQRTAECIVNIPVSQSVVELVEVSRVLQDRIQQRFVEQTDEAPDLSFAEKIIEKPVTQTQGKTQQVVNTHVQHVVNTVDAEVPLSQFTDKAVDIPVVAQRQISTVQTVQTSIEIPQLQYCDEAIDAPAVFVVLVPQVHVVEKKAEIPQFQVDDKVVDVPVESVVQGPLVHVVAKTVQTPQLLFREKIVVIPRIQTIQGPQTSESLNGEISTFQLEMQMGTMFAEEQDVFTEVNADLEQVACETCVKDNTAMVAREGTSSTSGSKHQQRTSGPAGKEEGEKKKMEGRKKEEREAEEGGGELVEKEVTGWTEVTRNKRKKMVQIFVKVDGIITVAMEVSPEDKVQKILNTVSGSDRDMYVTSGGRILKGSDKLKSCEVRDGSTVQVMRRMRGGGKHTDKKGKEEKKQVAQLDDGMCAMACEQMRQVMETLRTLADKSTGERDALRRRWKR